MPNYPRTRPCGKREADRDVDAFPAIVSSSPVDAFRYLTISWGYVPSKHAR